MLAAGPLGTVGINAQIARINLDLDVVIDQRVDKNRGERGVAPALGIER